MLSYLYYKNGKKVFDILKNGKDLLSIIIFGIFGMMGTQYTYFTAIEYSNAAIATVLTYFGPTLVLVYVYMREARRPLKYEIFSIVLSMFGVFLLATHGNFSGLQISFKALFWGLLSATIFAIIFMGVTFGFLDIIGFICVISTIFIVAIFDKKEVKKKVK